MALSILSRAMLQFQPAGLTERSAILSALEAPVEANSVALVILQLRRWIRWKGRALEVGVSIPDSSILMKGLGRLVKRIVTSHPDLNFRLSLVKSSLMVETVPTLETVTQYNEHFLAELEQMGQQARKKEVMAEGQPKVCRRGRGCPFGHQLDGEKKCWTCGGRDHMATTCPTTEESESKPRQHRRVQRPLKAMPPTSPKILHSGGVFTFFGVLGGKKKVVKLQDLFWALFGGCLLFFGACEEPKHCNLQWILRLWHGTSSSCNMLKTT